MNPIQIVRCTFFNPLLLGISILLSCSEATEQFKQTHPVISSNGALILFTSDSTGNDEVFLREEDGKVINLSPSSATDTRADISPDGKWVVFDSDRDGDHEIFLVKIDGDSLVQLTFNDQLDMFPKWSPDASSILFHSDRDGNREVYVMDSNGKNQQNLTNRPNRDGVPSWSPDGERIIFHSVEVGDQSLHFQIYVMDKDGRNIQALTNSDFPEEFGSWSPNGKLIAYYREDPERKKPAEIYVMPSSGGKPRQLTKAGDFDSMGEYSSPSWYPDSQRLAFWAKQKGAKTSALFTVDLDGMVTKGVVNKRVFNNSHGLWTNDGEKIIFYSDRDGDNEIYMINSNGSSPQNLTKSPQTNDLWPSNFTPDGEDFAYTSVIEGNFEIFQMNLETRTTQNISNHEGRDGVLFYSKEGSIKGFQTTRDGNFQIYRLGGQEARNLTKDKHNNLLASIYNDRIYFSSDRLGSQPYQVTEIFSMDFDGNDIKRVTHRNQKSYMPSFSPDGSKMVFWGYDGNNSEIMIADPDGSNVRNLTNHLAFDNWPKWSPDGTKILFTSNRGGQLDLFVMNIDGSNVTQITWGSQGIK